AFLLNRSSDLAERLGCRAYLLDDPNEMQREWFEKVNVIGVTAGASAPEDLVQQVVAKLKEWGGDIAEEMPGVEENIVFALPKTLRDQDRL
ncbi:MAG: 4-hydroxy-3-methylbut-2-enyl diphosphate reductase, partial [uncultured bacterium]